MNAPPPNPEPDALAGAPHPRHTGLLFGQARAESVLLDAARANRLHHGWLITGPRGVGKATLAWCAARFLLNAPAGGATPATLATDPQSPVNRRLSALTEPRLFLCRRPWDERAERLKKEITVDEVRKLRGFFGLSAADGGRRVVIVDAADEMNASAANALLKVLEEPPADTTLFLVSHRPMSLLATIRSRCREVRCAPLLPDDLAAALAAAGFGDAGDPAALGVLAAGSVGEAIRILAEDGLAVYTSLVSLLRGAPGLDRPALAALAASCTQKAGEARYDLVVRLSELLLHRLAMTGVRGAPGVEAAPGEADVLARLSRDGRAARGWAELAETLAARTAHARAVNLDPASVILDMFLRIDRTAESLRAA